MAAQASVRLDALTLVDQRLGPLPLVNHFLNRLGLAPLLDRFLPALRQRSGPPPGRALGVLLRSILLEREPIYRQAELAASFAPSAFGLEEGEAALLGDDRVGRALDQLFDADRASLLTEVVLSLHRKFGVAFERFHNDSTSVRFCGQYPGVKGHSIRGKKAPWITYGHSKDHRPDLKQLVYILTTSDDGHVPVGFRCEDGNTNDSRTHIQTWDELRALTGRSDFLYVADAKLCSYEAMDHIDRAGGKFITVLPRSRGEDAHFRRWIQTNDPAWEVVRDRPNPRGRGKPRDVWRAWRSDLPSQEGWPLIWLHSNLLALHQAHARRIRIEKTKLDLGRLKAWVESPRSRLRRRREIHDRLRRILVLRRTTRYLRVKVGVEEVHRFKQVGPGRPGKDTTYRRTTRRRFTLTWHVDEKIIDQERRHDGMYQLITNDRSLTPRAVFEEHKRQPRLERRFCQLKDTFLIAPVFLKNAGRIEALFFLYAIALVVQALIEREIRAAMKRDKIPSLEIYPEERHSSRPTALQIFRLFANVHHQELRADGERVKTFPAVLTPIQREVLRLLGVPLSAYRPSG